MRTVKRDDPFNKPFEVITTYVNGQVVLRCHSRKMDALRDLVKSRKEASIDPNVVSVECWQRIDEVI